MKKLNILGKLMRNLLLVGVLSLMFCVVASADENTPVACNVLAPTQNVQDLINSGVAPSSTTALTQYGQNSQTFSFTVDQEGWIYAAGTDDQNGYTKCILYSDPACGNEIASALAKPGEVAKAYVKAGTYYYRINRTYGYSDYAYNTNTYIAFRPTASVISTSVTYSKDKTKATIRVNLDGNYKASVGSQYYLRVEARNIDAYNLANSGVWHVDTNKNVVKSNTYKASKNGSYSIRLSRPDSDEWYITRVNVRGIQAAPKVPTVKGMKAKAKTISGKAAKKCKVVIYVKGKKYVVNTGNKTSWKLKLKTKLKKGQKVKFYVMNKNGAKSKTITKKVKK
ncbi:hypothetical protein lbkm_0135 [Lachnospiraceae bacterium KM106-2]|nr:hypothetical protein lbkm_0135 [Lachnospiraceae bacterium KM106-2]